MQLTQSASAELHRLLANSNRPADAAVRLVVASDGSVHIELGRAQPGDVALDGPQVEPPPRISMPDDLPLRIAAPDDLPLAGAVLHFRASGDDRYGPPGFTLLRQRGATVRGAGRPIEAALPVRPSFADGVRRALGLARGRDVTTPSGAQ